MVFSIEYRVKKEKEKYHSTFHLTTSPKFTLTIIIISKLTFIISLFDKISKHPSLIIYADLKITTIDKKSIEYMVSSIESRKRRKDAKK